MVIPSKVQINGRENKIIIQVYDPGDHTLRLVYEHICPRPADMQSVSHLLSIK